MQDMMEPTSATNLSQCSDEELREIIASHPKERMTLAQRAQGTLDRRSDVRKAIRHYRNQATIGFVVLLMGLGGVRALDLHEGAQSRQAIARSGTAVAVHSCNRDFRTSLRQRQAFQRETAKPDGNPQHLPPAELDRRIKAVTPLPDCRKATHAITTDPDARIRIPKPLYREPKRKGG